MGDHDLLVQRLCVAAGVLMDNASPTAVSSLPIDRRARRKQLRELVRIADEIAALARAAAALDRLSEIHDL